jgi:hypothetical protein
MTTTNLIKKLNKMQVSHNIVDVNGYNQDIHFVINGKKYIAGYNVKNNVIEDYCMEICYDNANQEMQRRFFDNFNKVLNHATR